MKSPEPKEEKKDLVFLDAIGEVMTGKSITKREWDDTKVHGILKDGHLMLHKADGEYYDWIITDGDLFGDDFYVL